MPRCAFTPGASLGAGLVPPAAALFLLGRGGAILMVIMLFMAVTSSGSAELVAVSSLFTYDVYRTYINPNATGALPMRLPVPVRWAAQGPGLLRILGCFNSACGSAG